MNIIKSLLTVSLIALACACNPSSHQNSESTNHDLSIPISKRYLNLPVSQGADRAKMIIESDGKQELSFVIRLAPSKPDYWVFYDVSGYMGKVLKISYAGNPGGLNKIYQDNDIAGQDSLYRESNRPQIHFTSRRGWNNDPNGLIYFDGEYHLFYQHNPFEREWENMSWGHAVSTDLIHWKELPDVMYPDESGAIFSGTAVIDKNNTSGFGKDGIFPMIAIYTANSPDNERQCISYSLDKGRTFTKYEGNPVIDSKVRWNSSDLRDPKVFWYEPTKKWIMVLFERDGNSIYTSGNLKEWNYESHTPGFWECPQFFELAIDGNITNTKWVMYGASGTYMTGSFDGKTFTPEKGKYCYGNGALYAAQTFDNIPASDGRRIQIGWGRIQQPGMPFNQMMLLPTELTLRNTKEGIRMFNVPVKEVDMLQEKEYKWEDLDQEKASELLKQFNNAVSMRIKTSIKLSHATDAGLSLFGQDLFKYDMNFNQINGYFYSPEDRTSMEINADIIIDKTSVEVFIDNGAFSYAIERKAVAGNKDGFKFFGNKIDVKSLKVYPMKSIWK
jgi:fructan beta-fructosidase